MLTGAHRPVATVIGAVQDRILVVDDLAGQCSVDMHMRAPPCGPFAVLVLRPTNTDMEEYLVRIRVVER